MNLSIKTSNTNIPYKIVSEPGNRQKVSFKSGSKDDFDTFESKSVNSQNADKIKKKGIIGAFILLRSILGPAAYLISKQREKKQAAKEAEEQKKLEKQQAKEQIREYFRYLEEQERIQAEQEAALKAEAEQAKIKAEQESRLELTKQINGDTARSIKNKFEEQFSLEKIIETELKPKNCDRINPDNEQVKKYINVHCYEYELLNPKNVLLSVTDDLDNNTKNGGSFCIEEIKTCLSSAKSSIERNKNYFGKLDNQDKIDRYDKKSKEMSTYITDVSAELDKLNPKEGESVTEIYKRAVQEADNTHIKRRQEIYKNALANYAEQLVPIKERLVYTEEPAVPKNIELSETDKQETADLLNKYCDLRGDRKLTSESSLNDVSVLWKRQYISGAFSMENKKAETAILEMFPKYKTRNTNTNDGFKYEPLYRFMSINDTENFLKQFDEIGGVYEPERLQSCSKEKYYGESYLCAFTPCYNFTDWNPNYNVKFIIHPQGEVTKAVNIGEGKYGDSEVIYPADSKFKILGTVKRKVTPEEIKENIHEDFKFDDFEKWEIHLQEM